MAFAFNYNNLITEISAQLNRNDAVFLAQCPVFITLAEQRIFVDFSQLGNEQYYTGNFVAGVGTLAKPPLWGKTLTFSYLDSNGNVVILERISYEYARKYINNPTAQNALTLPKYYTDKGYGLLLVVPTPQIAFQFEWVFLAKATPLGLSVEQQTNWYTTYGYDLLLAACCYYASVYLDNVQQQAKWDKIYKERIELYNIYNKGRKADRNADVLMD